MSRVSNFNDLFDTYISFSFEDVIQNLIPEIIEANIEIDESIKPLVPTVFNLLITNEQSQSKNNLLMKYLIICLKKHPNILTGTENPDVLTTELLELIMSDLISGNISEEEVNAFSELDTNLNALIANLIKECISNPQLFEMVGMDVNGTELQQVQEVFDSKSPEVKSVKEKYQKVIESTKP